MQERLPYISLVTMAATMHCLSIDEMYIDLFFCVLRLPGATMCPGTGVSTSWSREVGGQNTLCSGTAFTL